MRRPGTLATIILLGALASACGGSSTTGATAGTDSGATVDASAEPPSGPTAAPEGGGDIPVIADGSYTSGTSHVELSDGKDLTVDGQLAAGSMTVEGSTVLIYQGGEGDNMVVFSVANATPDGPAISLTSASIITAGDRNSGCAIEFTRNDGSGLAGTFDCADVQGVGPYMGTVDVKGTFSAER